MNQKLMYGTYNNLFVGLEGFPTCNVHGRALEHATRIMNRKFSDSKDTPTTPIIGNSYYNKSIQITHLND